MSKIIALYGQAGSGRSTFAVALAAHFATHRRNVIVLSPNRVVPMLKPLVPSANITKSLSIGGLFLSDNMTQGEVCGRIVSHPSQANLGFMGFATGDTPNAYGSVFNAEYIKALYGILMGLADILIVDCISDLSAAGKQSEPLGATALASADVIIKLILPEITGIEYCKTMFPYERELPAEKRITVLGRCAPTSPVRETASVLGEDIKYCLPESVEIAECFRSGKLITAAKSSEGREYTGTVSEIAKEAVK